MALRLAPSPSLATMLAASVALLLLGCTTDETNSFVGQTGLDTGADAGREAGDESGADLGPDLDAGADAVDALDDTSPDTADEPDLFEDPDVSDGSAPDAGDASLDLPSDDAGDDVDAGPGETVRFVAFGDWGIDNLARIEAGADAMWSVCQTQGCDFALGLGDNFYETGVSGTDDAQWADKYEGPFADWDIPLYMTLGNHDYGDTPGAQVEYTDLDDRWTMPSRWYELDAGPVHFAALDTNRATAAQGNALLDGLRLTDRPWRIGFGHHPMRSNGVHGDSGGGARELVDWVLCGQADLYLAGHDHDLQHLEPSCGVDLVISGAVTQTRTVDTGDNTLFASSERGFAWLEVSERRLRLEMHDLSGKVVHAWERTRSARALVCGADDYCEPDCADDPDCAGVDCSGDGDCDRLCPYDPDCFRACPCDYNPGICEPLEDPSVVPCGCDPDCRGAQPPCQDDGHCDTWCPSGADPDCG